MVSFFNSFFAKPFLYPLILFITGALSAAAAFFLLTVTPENVNDRKSVPRSKVPGILLGAVVLLWCIPNCLPVLPDSLHRFLLPTAILLIILSWCALDHLLARAAAGFMILSAHYILWESYASPAPLHSLFAAIVLIFGTIGIWFSGRPYDVRDLIRCSARKKYRYIMPSFLLLVTLFTLFTGIWVITQGRLS